MTQPFLFSLQIPPEQTDGGTREDVEVRRQLKAGYDGPDHGDFQIVPRQVHVDGDVSVGNEHGLQQTQVPGGRIETILGQVFETPLCEPRRNGRGRRTVGVRVGRLGQGGEQRAGTGKPRARAAG